MNNNRNRKIVGTSLILIALILIGFTLVSATRNPGSEEADIPLNNIMSGNIDVISENSPTGADGSNTTIASAGANSSDNNQTPSPTNGQNNNGKFPPSRIQIPKIGVDAHVQQLGVTESGLMAAPKNLTDVSWFKLGTIPGETGSAVMAGHEDNAVTIDGVFKHLEDLEIGDSVYVKNNDGSTLHFKVIKKSIHPYNLSGSELNNIFARSGGRYLNLITCTGEWLPEAKTNDRRLVVYTELVS